MSGLRARVLIGYRQDAFASGMGAWISPPNRDVLKTPLSNLLLASSSEDVNFLFIDKVQVTLARAPLNASVRRVRISGPPLFDLPLVFPQAVAGQELIEPVMQRNTSLAVKTGTPPRYTIIPGLEDIEVINRVERSYKLNLLIAAV